MRGVHLEQHETIQHLFYDCRFTRMVWAMVHAAWGISKPCTISNMFVSWLNGIPENYKHLLLVGAAVLCWSVWIYRNAVVFENKHSSFLQVI